MLAEIREREPKGESVACRSSAVSCSCGTCMPCYALVFPGTRPGGSSSHSLVAPRGLQLTEIRWSPTAGSTFSTAFCKVERRPSNQTVSSTASHRPSNIPFAWFILFERNRQAWECCRSWRTFKETNQPSLGKGISWKRSVRVPRRASFRGSPRHP